MNGDSEYILVTSRVAVKAHFQSPNVDISNSAMLEENIALLEEISQLMPNQGISIVLFRQIYSELLSRSQTDAFADAILHQVLHFTTCCDIL